MSKDEPRNGFRIKAEIQLLAMFKKTLAPQGTEEIVLESWGPKDWIDTNDMESRDPETNIIGIATAEEITEAITRIVYAGIELAIDYIGEHDDLPVLLENRGRKDVQEMLIDHLLVRHP